MHIYTLFTLMKVAAVQTPIYLATKDSTNVYKSTCKHFDDCFVWYHHCICYKGCVIPCSCSAQNINGRLSVWANRCHIEHSCYTVHYICLTLVTMHPLAGWLAGWLVFLLTADSFELLACIRKDGARGQFSQEVPTVLFLLLKVKLFRPSGHFSAVYLHTHTHNTAYPVNRWGTGTKCPWEAEGGEQM